ncbi:sirohydrochlorin cobaltochelatase [uncultured Ilyobacter sp.]|uniref:sirohydrochlorin cobaltochelatase n=1 Tax=uncultured Ilyobacter sp. TaxID=544433 RepID=UPI0029C713C1|nr:sirohydrochlorin cobaltochelatase [uncultured Ilyobacter sp.]
MSGKSNFNCENPTERKGILVASFGTSHGDTRKAAIEECENRITESFPEHEVYRAFTSNIVRKVLKERDGESVDDVSEALIKMRDEKFTEVIVQPLHIIPGEEYQEKIIKVAESFRCSFKRIAVGRPLLNDIDDYRIAAEALKNQLNELKEDHSVVLMGHGSHHPANACYSCFQMIINDEIPNVFIGTVEGYPELGDIIPKLKSKNIKRVSLMPYMLVAGDHAKNDMAGEEEDSWKRILEKEGFEVDVCLKGLGENPAYQNIFVNHARDAMEG